MSNIKLISFIGFPLLLIAKTFGTEFPEDFLFGVATSAYQIEGGWNASDKGPNIWDVYTHAHPERIKDGSNGDVACNSYNKLNEDLEILSDLNVQFYRFSISWARILPTGFNNIISKDGVRYYNNLIDGLLERNIIPFVTLFHWELPQSMQDLGGWTNPMIADYFRDYANVVFSLFGDRVRYWFTFNESPCPFMYTDGTHAPGIKSDGLGDYLCMHTILLSHGKAYRLYEAEYKKRQNGQVGLIASFTWIEPKTNKTADILAAQRAIDMDFGWYVHPVFSKQGDYPPTLKERVANMSKEENYPRSRLPQFTADEIEMLRGSSDFMGINFYTADLASDREGGPKPSRERDIGVKIEKDPSWPGSVTSWLSVVPWAFGKALKYVRDTYDNPVVYVMENGYADKGGINDTERVQYYTDYLEELALAIKDGCRVKGYAAWSFLDNFEWAAGYTISFGLYKVDFTDPGRPRTPKESAKFYKRFLETRDVEKLK